MLQSACPGDSKLEHVLFSAFVALVLVHCDAESLVRKVLFNLITERVAQPFAIRILDHQRLTRPRQRDRADDRQILQQIECKAIRCVDGDLLQIAKQNVGAVVRNVGCFLPWLCVRV